MHAPRITARSVREPAAHGAPHEGGREIEIPVDLSTIPIFARAGAVVPSRRVVQYTDQEPLRELILKVYPGSGGGAFYHDDGRSGEHRNGEYGLERYETASTTRGRSIGLVERDGSDQHLPGRYRFVIHGVRRGPIMAG